MNSSDNFNEDYFENGTVLGISGYFNYQWLPELTLRMTYHMIHQLGIKNDDKILDFGCAKGYLVKSFRIFDIEAYGLDISTYAINHIDSNVSKYCSLISSVKDSKIYSKKYDWMIAKDVFEHIEETDLNYLIKRLSKTIKKLFVVIPLSKDDNSNKFIIQEYDKIIHMLR